MRGYAPRVTSNGLVDREGRERSANVIIWGTGFKPLDFVALMKIFGLEGPEPGET